MPRRRTHHSCDQSGVVVVDQHGDLGVGRHVAQALEPLVALGLVVHRVDEAAERSGLGQPGEHEGDEIDGRVGPRLVGGSSPSAVRRCGGWRGDRRERPPPAPASRARLRSIRLWSTGRWRLGQPGRSGLGSQRFKVVAQLPASAQPGDVAERYAWELESLAPLGAVIVECAARSDEEFLAVAHDADAVITSWGFPITAGIIAGMSRCVVIGVGSVGVDMVDVDAATGAGIVVTNTPDIFIEEVADHALALILACARRVVEQHHLVTGGRWLEGRPQLSALPRLWGRTLGLVSFGNVARATARRAAPFGVHLLAYDPFVSELTMTGEGRRAGQLARRAARALRHRLRARPAQPGHLPPDRRGRAGPPAARRHPRQHRPGRRGGRGGPGRGPRRRPAVGGRPRRAGAGAAAAGPPAAGGAERRSCPPTSPRPPPACGRRPAAGWGGRWRWCCRDAGPAPA